MTGVRRPDAAAPSSGRLQAARRRPPAVRARGRRLAVRQPAQQKADEVTSRTAVLHRPDDVEADRRPPPDRVQCAVTLTSSRACPASPSKSSVRTPGPSAGPCPAGRAGAAGGSAPESTPPAGAVLVQPAVGGVVATARPPAAARRPGVRRARRPARRSSGGRAGGRPARSPASARSRSAASGVGAATACRCRSRPGRCRARRMRPQLDRASDLLCRRPPQGRSGRRQGGPGRAGGLRPQRLGQPARGVSEGGSVAAGSAPRARRCRSASACPPLCGRETCPASRWAAGASSDPGRPARPRPGRPVPGSSAGPPASYRTALGRRRPGPAIHAGPDPEQVPGGRPPVRRRFGPLAAWAAVPRLNRNSGGLVA